MWWLSVFFMLLLLCLYDACGESRQTSEGLGKVIKRPKECEPHGIGLCMGTVTRAIASLLGGR